MESTTHNGDKEMTVIEEFRKLVDDHGDYYYWFNKLCDNISEKDLVTMLKKEKMVNK